MGSYAYHEFRAVDRALTSAEREEVERLSSRAEVSAHHAAFTYNYSSFRGDEKALLTSCFDAMLSIASWGTLRVIFSVPREGFDPSRAQRYALDPPSLEFSDWGVTVEVMEDRVLVGFVLDEMSFGWVEGEGLLEPLLGLREQLMMGDDRPLYLGWLAAWWHGLVDDEGHEPPIPAGMGQLEAHHNAFADLFQIPDAALLSAADLSPPLKPAEPTTVMSGVIDALTEAERRELLLRVGLGEARQVQHELRRRATATQGAPPPAPGRSLEQLSEAIEENQRVAERRREEAAREQARQAHEKRLNQAERMESFLWKQVEQRLTGDNRQYKKAAEGLALLLEVAQRRGAEEDFMRRARPLLEANRGQATFIRRMEEIDLGHLL